MTSLLVPRVPSLAHKPTAYKTTDFSSQTGASLLCQMIELAWQKAGYDDVRAWPVKAGARDEKTDKIRQDVRTNLINGLPPSVVHRVPPVPAVLAEEQAVGA